ncbi:hypothetical protein CMV_015506 [Castanea mollissima]|uniref:Leucine-rich repeat-containing N-terminal plant-type domain-containing protein n=1 Tax=Castanea mollissima TaxID=60419 RepID=A0A8J4R545_9ROSI|nr:hypothetical protein CMV_015506 [Castanea mollissima]
MEAFFRPVSFPFLAFLFLPNFFFFFCTGLSELRCIDTERQALLNFKQHLIDPSNRLSSWTAHGDCCQWEGVVCHNDHNVTGHVHELHLRTSYPEGGFATTEQDEAYAAVNVWCFSHIEFLNLGSNNLQGTISSAIGNLTSAISIDLSYNQLGGKLPRSLVQTISKVNEPKMIAHLNLEKNLLSGIIPDCLMNWNNLEVLNLRNNNFSGSIPTSMGSLTYLKSLHLYNNKFSGKLPSSLKNCEKLVIIDVAKNRFAGNIPSWIGHRCTSLVILSLRSNYFHGHIPKELCALTSLQILDLSHNNLSGSIPRRVKIFRAMATNNISKDLNTYRYISGYGQYFSLESALLVIKGSIREYSTILQLVKSIDFSKNNLSGEIPKEVTSLQGLQSLNLSYNFLIGSIPENIGTMGSLESIDFSLNQLSGQIPSSMSSLTFLNHLNLSNNNLTGKIPLSTQLQSLNPSSYVGNKLCGPPLTVNCTTNGVKPNNENISSKETGGLEVDWFYVSMALGFVVGFWSVCGPLLLNKQWRIMYFQFLDHMGYKLKGFVSL